MPGSIESDHPIEELKRILDEASPEIAEIFGPALTIFAGPSAMTKDENTKKAELERLILKP